MSNKDLRKTPHTISASKWCYEEPRGIEIYTADAGPDGIRHFTITWRYLRSALKRKDKK